MPQSVNDCSNTLWNRDKKGKNMVKIDLITGFLGSGKTTFIRNYASYLLEQGMTVGILENDYGSVNVDMLLLQDLESDSCELEMISGCCCDQETHGRRFRTKLISMAMCGYDRVLVEPSGIYDMDEFFDVLREEPIDQWYEIGSVIAIVDSGLEEELSPQADYLLASEAAHAGVILLSRSQEASMEKKQAVVAHLNRALKAIGCDRVIQKEVLDRDWDQFTKADFERILQSGYVMESYQKSFYEARKGFETLYFVEKQMKEEELNQAVRSALQDPACGSIFRIKGFMEVEKDHWVELNATKKKITIKPIAKGQNILIVIGETLCIEELSVYFGNPIQ